MCLAIPAKVVAFDGGMAVVELGGVKKEVSLALVDGVTLGDYVIVHVGYVLQKLDTAEAERTLAHMASLASPDDFVLESAIGDEYRGEPIPPEAVFPLNFGQTALAFG